MATSRERKSRPPRPYFPERTPQHYYPHLDVAYVMVPQPYAVMNTQPYVRPQQQFNQNQALFLRNQPPHQAQYNPDLHRTTSPTMPVFGNHLRWQTSHPLASHIPAFSPNLSRWVCCSLYPKPDRTQRHLLTDPVLDVLTTQGRKGMIQMIVGPWRGLWKI